MTDGFAVSSDVAFTPTVKSIQSRKGSRASYSRMEERGGWQTTILPDLAAMIADTRSFFLATSNAESQPYIQHRGGPRGFLRVIDEKTIAFADFKGNRQFITQGNLVENPKAFIFLIDYARRQRIKIWGEARVVEDDDALLASLMPENYKANGEQVIIFTITAWDVNCPQHIPRMIDVEDVLRIVAEKDAKIAELESRLALLANA